MTHDARRRASTAELRIVDPLGAPAQAALAAYADELDRRFPGGFDPGPANDVATCTADHGGAFVVVMMDDDPVACGGLRDLGDGVVEIKRMWVHHDWRGVGLGGRLLRHLEAHARHLGYGVVRLDTNGTLVEAIAMYERSGYRRVDRYNDNPYAQAFFEKPLDQPGGEG